MKQNPEVKLLRKSCSILFRKGLLTKQLTSNDMTQFFQCKKYIEKILQRIQTLLQTYSETTTPTLLKKLTNMNMNNYHKY